MDFSFSFMLECLAAGAQKIPITLLLAFFAVLFGSVFGAIVALIRFFEVPVASHIFKWLITILKGIPIILILLIVYVLTADHFNDVMQAIGIDYTFRQFNKAIIAVVALSILATVGLSESFRGALSSVKKGQYDAAYSIGLTKWQALLEIVLPQAFPISIPTLCNYMIGLFKAGALLGTITVVDIMNGALIPANSNYRFLEGYAAAAVIYWFISAIMEKVFAVVEKRFAGKVREVPA
jgi:L-cystine transport system permease protein